MKLHLPTCFFEHDPETALARRVVAEGVGTFLLMLAVTGSGLNAETVFSGQSALNLLASASVIAGALVSLIVALGPVSGGHFNPLITVLQWLAGQRRLDCTLAYVAAQLSGAIGGALLASYAFDTNSVSPAKAVASWALISSEIIASASLMLVVFGCARGQRTETGPFAVGAWLAAAIVTLPSGSYANPAVVLGAVVSRGASALPGGTAFYYVPAEILGALVALAAVEIIYPLPAARDRS